MIDMFDKRQWYAVSDDEFAARLARLRKLQNALDLGRFSDADRDALKPVAVLDDSIVDALAEVIAKALGEAHKAGRLEVLAEQSNEAVHAFESRKSQ